MTETATPANDDGKTATTDVTTETRPAARPRNRISLATLVVAALILVTALGILGLDIYRTAYPSAEGLAGMVQTSMNDYLASDDDLRQYSPQVGQISVMRVGDNTFEGQADITTNVGKSRYITVHVHYDGDAMFWETDPGAFAFMVR